LTRLKVVCVAPCYDKKLEAARPDFTLISDENQTTPPKEVDTVLATHELLDLCEIKGIDINTVEPWAAVDQHTDSVMSPTEIRPLEQLI